MPYLSSRQHSHTEPHVRRTGKSHGIALTAILVLFCGAALFYCGATLFDTVMGS